MIDPTDAKQSAISKPAGGPTSQTANPALVVSGLCKSYGDRTILNDIGFSLGRGERLALTGPSGSGKTTLLNCLGGVDRADRGSIVVHGRELFGMNSDELARLRRQHIGTIFQFFHLLPTLSAFENVELPLQLLGFPPRERTGRIENLLERVNLIHRRDALPTQLSGGEMQRVAIARSLVTGPDLLLADEPTGNLDSANGAIILELLENLSNETGTALVLVTHSEEAARICQRTIHVRDGRIVDGRDPESHSNPA